MLRDPMHAFRQFLRQESAAGLLFGKSLGVFGFSWLVARLGLVELPQGLSAKQVLGLSCICGIGFTISLFIGALAFSDTPILAEQGKMGVLLGSALPAITAVPLFLALSPRR